MPATAKKLGKLSLAMLEGFVAKHLGDKFVDELRSDTDIQAAIGAAFTNTEERFFATFQDRPLYKALFFKQTGKAEDVPNQLKKAVGDFYDHPTDPAFPVTLTTVLQTRYPEFEPERIGRGVAYFITVLTEELAQIDEDFDRKVQAVSNLRSAQTQERMAKLLEEMKELLEKQSQTAQPAQADAYRALHQLPPPPADFTGRADEIEQLLAALADGKRAAISGLTGMGGIGKTALGLVAAHKLAAQFPDAQFFLDLKGTTTPLAPADAMRHVILSFEPTADLRALDKAGLAAAYRDALHGKKALLFLDNAREAAQVKPLIPPESCCLLVTSRWHFALPGLNPLRLDVLKTKEAQDFLLELCPRLGKAAPELAKRCGCLPMALRIAASFLACNEDWTPAEYLQRLAEGRKRLETLKSKDDPDLDVEAAFRLSYLCLPEADRKHWRALGVFPASFRQEAAQALWELAEDPAHGLLTTLHNYSLLDILPSDSRSPLPQGEGQGGEVRYRLHDLLAEYARQEMMPEELDEVRLRHAEYFFAVLGNADGLVRKGGENILVGLSLFDAESAHIYAAQKWAAENAARGGRMAELAMLYPDAGVFCLDLRLTPKQRIEWLSSAVTAARALGRKDAEGVHLGNLGSAYYSLGDARRAIEYHEQKLVIVREIGDRRSEGAGLGNLGLAYAALGDARRAIEFYEQRLVIAREIGDRRGEGAALGNLGLAYADLGDARRAIEFQEQALVIDREIGDRRGEANALGNLGLAYATLGDTRRAIEFSEQALVIAREIGDKCAEGSILGNLGLAYATLGDIRRAIEFYEQALVISREIGDKRAEGSILGNLGNAYFALGDARRAIEFYEQALVIAREIGDKRNEGIWLDNLGLAYATLGDIRRAIEFYEQALVISREIGDKRAEGSILGNLGNAYFALGDARRAIEFYEQVLVIAREIGDKRNEGIWLGNLGNALYGLREKEKGLALMKQALAIFEAIESPHAGWARDKLKEWGA